MSKLIMSFRIQTDRPLIAEMQDSQSHVSVIPFTGRAGQTAPGFAGIKKQIIAQLQNSRNVEYLLYIPFFCKQSDGNVK